MSESKDEQTELLREIAKWLRFIGMKEIKTVLKDALNDEKKIIAYYHSDGKNTSRMISQISDMSQTNVSDLWKDWLSIGLGDAIPTSGGSRFKKSFDLKMFGIVVPEIKQTTNNEQKAETQANEGEIK